MRDYCKAVIDSFSEVAGLAGTSAPNNLNMVMIEGVEVTQDEVNTLLKVNEEYCRQVRAVTHGWIARLPAERERRKAQKKEE